MPLPQSTDSFLHPFCTAIYLILGCVTLRKYRPGGVGRERSPWTRVLQGQVASTFLSTLVNGHRSTKAMSCARREAPCSTHKWGLANPECMVHMRILLGFGLFCFLWRPIFPHYLYNPPSDLSPSILLTVDGGCTQCNVCSAYIPPQLGTAGRML